MALGKFKFAEAYTEMTLEGWSGFTAKLTKARQLITGSLITPFKVLGGVIRRIFTPTGLLSAFLSMRGIVAGVRRLLYLGSQLEEIESKFQAVFKEQAELGRAFATTFAKGTGRARSEVMGFMAALQDMFVPLGFARDKAREMAQSVTQLGYDITSFNPEARNAAETLDLMKSAIVGNHEAVRRFGIIITEAALKQKMLEMGYKGNYLAATNQMKVLARLVLLYEGSADAMGDLIRTGGSFKNVMAKLYATLKTGAEKLATALIPVAKALAALADAVLTVMGQVTGARLGTVADVLARIGAVIHGIAARVRGIDFSQWRQQLGDLAKELGSVFRKVFEALLGTALILGRRLIEELAIFFAAKLKEILPRLAGEIKVPTRTPTWGGDLAMDILWRRAGMAATTFGKRFGGIGAGGAGGDFTEQMKASVAELTGMKDKFREWFKELAKAAEMQDAFTKAQKRLVTLQQQLRTPLEVFRDTMRDLISLRKTLGPAFDAETYRRAEARAFDVLKKAEDKDTGKRRAPVTAAFRQMATYYAARKQEEDKQLRLAEERNKVLMDFQEEGIVIKEMPDQVARWGP